MKLIAFLFGVFLTTGICNAQLVITNEPSALALAQRLVGDGVTISNVTFTGNSLMAGKFKNLGNRTNINIDSGIVLTNGRAKTLDVDNIGVDGDGFTPAASLINAASTEWGLPGDLDLANAIGATQSELNDACVLEFDFIPSGDTVKFKYVFSSEEYYEGYVCVFNDAFGFFISGPGITGARNIALVPNTTIPVSIFNVNNVTAASPSCINNPSYYIDNTTNTYFTHDGHTVVLTAFSAVQPCNTYHLKLVIADFSDEALDTGVFLEEKSLTSNVIGLTNNTRTDDLNNSYIVEGCITGSITIKRPQLANYPLDVRLSYGGTVVNGVDIQTLPDIITIPANDTVATMNIIPIVDNIPEGIELLKIYAAPGCGSSAPIDSTVIQIRDYDTLSVLPLDPFICKEGSIQLQATSNPTTTYQWEAIPGLNNYTISNPVATPGQSGVTYACTSTLGNCHGRDSVFIQWKDLEFNSSVDVNCRDGATGQIVVSGGPEWSSSSVQYSINNLPAQPTGTFTNLTVGDYMVHITDASGCKDSVPVNIIQAFPDLLIADTVLTPSSCTAANGTITITAGGGNPPYSYSSNGTIFQSGNVFNVSANTYNIAVTDINNCRVDMPGIVIPFINEITLATDAPDPVICESRNVTLSATTNAPAVAWTTTVPSQISTLSNANITNPVANPVVTTTYYIVATLGVCNMRDSVTVLVNPAPIANAGDNVTICNGGQTQLNATPVGLLEYHWRPATYLSNPDIYNPDVRHATGSTTYYLDVTDVNGCRSLVSDEIKVTVLPPAQLFAGYDTIIAINQPLPLMAVDINHIGFTEYSWSPATGLSNPFIPNPVAVLTDFTNYLVVTASTPDNCIGVDTIKVQTYKGPEIYVANSFTPNGDGTNDILKAFTVGIKTFNYLNIYNRYGQLVFSTKDKNYGWNGKVKGTIQNLSSFVWIAEGIDYKGRLIQRKGTTTIIQ